MDRKNIPNYLTYARAAAAPLALGLILFDGPTIRVLLFLLFLLAAVTDFLDGYLARKWQAASTRGALLDPIADKLLVAVMLLFIVTHGASYSETVTMYVHAGPLRIPNDMTVEEYLSGYALILPAALILLREIYISGLREFLAARGAALPVSTGGKWKTAVQMLAIGVLLFSLAWPHPKIWQAGEILLWIAAALALLSAADYTRKAWPNLR